MTEINRRTYLQSIGIAAAGIGLAGCSDSAAATGTLATQVTDQPGDIADFDSCVVTIQGIWLKPGENEDAEASDDEQADNDSAEDNGVEEQDEDDVDQSGGREYHEFDEPAEADLVELQDGNTQLIDEREIDVGNYQFLQLDVSDVEGVLENGDSATVETPGNAPLQFKHPFEIREDETTTFTGDFTPVRRGQTDRYLLQPVAKRTGVTYEGSEE